MILKIQDDLLVGDVQEQFSKAFPGLSIRFYLKPQRVKKPTSEADCVDPKAKVGDIRKNHKSGILQISPSDKVGLIEQSFKKLFGLNVQIFRNENNDWIQTTTTDDCNLEQQRSFSEHAKTSIYPKSKKQIDEYRFFL